MPDVTLIIFTCEGKEHLLPACFTSFKKACNYTFSKTILAIDGPIDIPIINHINPDIIIQNPIRKGYIHNILNALSLVDTEYFFWLEDDFDFKQEIKMDFMLDHLQKNEDWAEIILSRHAPLQPEEKVLEIQKPFYQLPWGFSASPVLCRTTFIKEGFQKILEAKKDETTKVTGFENFLSDYFRHGNIKCALLDPGNIPHLEHIGQLESTAREYHMINSLDTNTSDIGKKYISGFGDERKISLLSKFAMALKLLFSSLILIPKIFTGRKYYDIAMRTYLSIQKILKNVD